MTAAELQLSVVAQRLQDMSEIVATLARSMTDHSAQVVALQPPQPVETPHLTAVEAAKVLQCSPNTLAIWRMRGTGPKYISIGAGRRKTIRYAKSDLDQYIKAHTR